MTDAVEGTVKRQRGTSNSYDRGNTATRRARRAWMVETFASDQPGFCRCYRCGTLLYNTDAPPPTLAGTPDPSTGEVIVALLPTRAMPYFTPGWARPLTIDRVIPGCQGGRYVRNNIRPACGPCNSETGGSTRRKEPRQ